MPYIPGMKTESKQLSSLLCALNAQKYKYFVSILLCILHSVPTIPSLYLLATKLKSTVKRFLNAAIKPIRKHREKMTFLEKYLL